MKNKKIINIYLLIVIICFALSGCNDKKKENENVATSTDATPIDANSEKTAKDTTETTTNKVTTEESKTTEKEAAKDKTTATTTETSKPQTTQAPATTQATTEAPKPQTTQAPAITQTTTETPATTEHQHTWESVGHTETHDYRTDTGADVTGQQIVVHNGQECIITGYTGGIKCNVCGFKGTAEETDNHVWDVHDGNASTSTYTDPIYVTVNQKSVYVEDYQRCTTCGATK